MNTPLRSQVLRDQLAQARAYLNNASGTGDLALAKFALGFLTGIATAAAPVEEHYNLYAMGQDGLRMETIERVLDVADALTRRSYSYAERLEQIEREARRG